MADESGALSRETSEKRLSELNDPRLDSNNPAHIDAWIACRMKTRRVHATAVYNTIKSQQMKLTREAQIRHTFIVVPKSNMKEGIPKACARWFLSDDELQN